jgi:hypothetical protein
MKNKIISIFALTLVAILLSTASGASAATVATGNLQVVLTKQNPYPVEPGQVVDIEISLQNSGFASADNIVLAMNPKSPFSLLPGQEQIKTFTRVAALDHVTATYKLYVDKNAISDNYDLEFLYSNAGSDTQISNKVAIQVQGKPKLVLDNIVTEPFDIAPGDTVTLTASIKNVGTGSASSMEATLASNTSFIVPVLSGGLHYIGTINAGETKEATFEMSVDTTAEYTTYPGLLMLSFTDESGIAASDSFYVGIPIRGKPIIDILSAKIDGTDYKVDIENIGTANAKALKILLIQGGKTSDSAIANELRPAKSKTIRFTGYEFGQATINISYLDETNKFFSSEYPVTINKATTSSTQSGDSGLSPLVPVLIVVVVLESYYVWRIRKRLKK